MSGKPIAKILIGILTFSFVGWGAAEWILGNVSTESSIMKIGDTDLSLAQFNVEKSRELAKLPKEQQKQIYTEPESANAFFTELLAKMTNGILIENRADDLGFIITDRRIASEIRSLPDFQENGGFSSARFDTVLNNAGFTEAKFADYVRSQIKRSYILDAVSFPIAVPEFAVRAAYNSRYGERLVEYSEVKFADFAIGDPTDENLREFYAKNPKINPEARAVSYVLIPAEMNKPDKYEAGYAAAQKLEDALISGESMKSAAKNSKAEFVELKAFPKDNPPADKLLTSSLVSKIFSMEQGMESEVIETKQGFMIIRVDNVKPEHAAEFDSVKSSLTAAWKREEQKKRAYLRANELLIKLNEKGGLDGKKSAVVSRMAGAPTDVLVAAFRQAVGTNSIVAAQNSFYILHVEKKIAPKTDSSKMGALRKELQNMSARGILDDYSAFLKREYPVKVNKKVFDKMFAK
jgi:peptidyl-prolyl cis-trans isomerase D